MVIEQTFKKDIIDLINKQKKTDLDRLDKRKKRYNLFQFRDNKEILIKENVLGSLLQERIVSTILCYNRGYYYGMKKSSKTKLTKGNKSHLIGLFVEEYKASV